MYSNITIITRWFSSITKCTIENINIEKKYMKENSQFYKYNIYKKIFTKYGKLFSTRKIYTNIFLFL